MRATVSTAPAEQLDVNLVSTFVAVAELSSFSAAARSLGVPTSTVSRAVASLEAALGLRLLQRTTRHVSLTTDGAALYAEAAPALQTIRRALASAPEGGEPSGLLRITAAPDIGATFLAEALTRFTARYPSVRVDLSLTNRAVDLVGEGFDAAVRATAGPLKDSSLVARPLTTLDFQVYASPAYVARRGAPRTVADAAEHDWVHMRGWCNPRELAAVRRSAHITCDDFFFVREALRAGAGLGFLPTFLARADVHAGLLVQVVPKLSKAGGRLFLLYTNSDPVPKRLAAFRDHLLESFALSRAG